MCQSQSGEIAIRLLCVEVPRLAVACAQHDASRSNLPTWGPGKPRLFRNDHLHRRHSNSSVLPHSGLSYRLVESGGERGGHVDAPEAQAEEAKEFFRRLLRGREVCVYAIHTGVTNTIEVRLVTPAANSVAFYCCGIYLVSAIDVAMLCNTTMLRVLSYTCMYLGYLVAWTATYICCWMLLLRC